MVGIGRVLKNLEEGRMGARRKGGVEGSSGYVHENILSERPGIFPTWGVAAEALGVTAIVGCLVWLGVVLFLL